MDKTPKDIGRLFTEAREKKKLTPEDVSKKTRIHTGVIRDIEGGIFNRLGRLYIKSFLKKYAEAIGLDPEKIIRMYEGLAHTIHLPEINLTGENKNAQENVLTVSWEKKLAVISVALLSIVLVILIFVLFGTVREKITSFFAEKETLLQEERMGPPVVFMLKARGEVWVEVIKEGSMIFSGTLKEGDSKTWKDRGSFMVNTGRAEMLDFFINTRRIGSVASGVARNIEVSSKGVTYKK